MKGRPAAASKTVVSDRYEILRALGAGSAAEVFRARDTLFKRVVALKRFKSRAGEELKRTLASEFVLLAGLHHPALPSVHDFAVDASGRPFFTMDYLEGPSLESLLVGCRGARHADRELIVARYAGRILSALSYIHARGVVHGDIKPSNILFARKPRGAPPALDLRLVDFGLSFAVDSIASATARGTPRYMAPEVLRGGPPDTQSDLFSLGAVLRACLDTRRAVAPSSSPFASRLEAFISRLVEPSKSLRYRRAEEAFADLVALLETRDLAAAKELRTSFSFALRPRGWETGQSRLRERIAEARAGAGGAIVAEGLRGEPARRVLIEMAARARASGMRVEMMFSTDGGPGPRIRERLDGTLRRGPMEESRGPGPQRRGVETPASALAVRMRDSGRDGSTAGVVWFIESVTPLEGADVETLAHLAFALREAPSLVAVACPSVVGEPGRTVLAPRDRTIFPRLAVGDVELSLADLFGEIQPRVSLARVLHAVAGGDAAELERALASAVDRGALTRRNGGWIGDPARVKRAARETTTRAVRATTLTAALRAPARDLAVLGAEFDIGAARAVLGAEDPVVSRILFGLRCAGCVEAMSPGSSDTRWRFASPKAAESLAAALSPARRRLLHARALRHFRENHRGHGNPDAIARHLEGAGDAAGAAAMHVGLGRAAFESHDFLSACEHLERALDPPAPGSDGAAGVRFDLGKSLQSAGRLEASRVILQRLIDEESGVDPADVRISQAWNLSGLGRPAEGMALLQEALDQVPQNDRSRRGLVRAQMSWIEFMRRDFGEAERQLQAAREATGGEAAPRVMASIESLAGRLQAVRGNESAAEEAILRAAEIYRQSHDGWRRHTEMHALGLILIRKDPERAKEYFLGAREECARVGDDRGLFTVLGHLGSVNRTLGNWDAAAAEFRLAIDVGESLGLGGLHTQYSNLGSLLTDQGRFEEAGACFDRAAHLATAVHARFDSLLYELNRARLELRRNRPDASLELLEGTAPSLSPGDVRAWINLHLYRAEALAELGRFADADVSSRAATSAAASQEDETFKGEALLYGARVHRLSGRREAASDALDRAIAIFRRHHQRVYEARALLERAESLAAEPARTDDALESLDGAVAVFEPCGAAPFLARAARIRERLARGARRRDEAPRELQTLYRVGRLLEVVEDLPSLLEDLLDASIALIGAERGMIFLAAEGASKELVRAASRSLDESEARDVEKTSRGILKRALVDDSPLLSHDAKADSRLRSLKSVIRFEIRSVLCAPLRTGKTVLGTIYLDHRTPGRFGDKEAEFMRALAGLAAPAIAAAAARRKLDTEVRGLRQEVQALRTRDGDGMTPEVLVGGSEAMQRVRGLVEKCAASQASVLILGETGTGKDLVAKAIHEASPRAGKPFIAVGGADLQGDMSNADLFGAVEGAATGVHARPGKFEIASGGTLYFHAMESLPLDTQARLLRVLEEPYVERIGGTTKIPIDVRFLCATSADLNALVEAGGFRRDLYFRLNVVSIEIPPLRERREDIEPILRHYLAHSSRERGVPMLGVSSATLRTWQSYPWPGNVRQLRGLIDRAVVLGCAELPPIAEIVSTAQRGNDADLVESSAARNESLDAITARYVRRVLERCGGQKKLACRILEINYRTLQRYLGMSDPGAPTTG
ncbi:MAG: sigma 54-interacting transcriptional regulator [Acidobacteria bacterium]|nr:sigma 54-interacting transcriptional regulator [Acidobacteriota bacterium]